MRRALILMLLALPATVAAQRVTCPLRLSGESIAVRAPAGWVGLSPGARLVSAGMTRGHPSRGEYLIPRHTRRTKEGEVDVWSFDAGEEKWFWCGYGAEAVKIARKMDDAATECSVTSREGRPGVVLEMAAECRVK